LILLAVLASVALLVLLVAALRVQPFLGFIVSAIVAGMLLGLPLKAIPASLEHGIGGTLGSIAVILCLGAMFGKLIADSGAAVRIADTLIDCAGPRRIPLAMAATGFLVGIPLFYNVGFVLLVPLVFSVVYRSKLPAVYLAIPMLCGLSVAHGFLPPHPSPTALVKLFGADMGRTLIFGLIVAAAVSPCRT
jgi:H+/gluconate symporter-like permease